MPFYRFHVDVNASPQSVAGRLRKVVGEKPTFWESLNRGPWNWGSTRPPFVGSIQGNTFMIRRDIWYRNSFLPRVRGQIQSTPEGTRVNVTMFLHPFVALFMTFWLAITGYGAVQSGPDSSFALKAFAFVLALTVIGFFPEALKAKSLICKAVCDPALDLAGQTV